MVNEPFTKKALRKEYKNKRAELSDQEIEETSLKIIANIQKLLPAEPCNIHLFLAIEKEKEVNLSALIKILRERGDHIFVPRVIGKKMEHVKFTKDTELVVNNWGIPEPSTIYPACDKATLAEIDIIITPLLVCDEDGNRVGYGGGFYDGFFPLTPKALRAGVGFFETITKIEDVYEGDLPLNVYVSPNGIKNFKHS